MTTADIYELSMSYSYLHCVAGEKMLNRQVKRVLFYTGANAEQVRPGDLLIIRETFWNTYGRENFLSNLQDILIAGILLHHRCCSGEFFYYYAQSLKQLNHPVLVYDCPDSERLLQALQIALDGPDFYGSHILKTFQGTIKKPAYGKAEQKSYLDCLEQLLNKTAVFIPKDESQRTKMDAISDEFVSWIQSVVAAPDFKLPSFHWYEDKCLCISPVRTARVTLGYLVIFGEPDGDTYYRRALELLLDFLLPELALCMLAVLEQALPQKQEPAQLLRNIFFGAKQDKIAVMQAAGGRFQMARIAVALADEGDCEEDRWAVQQQFYKYLCDNAQVVFDSVVILNHRWCILGLRDARVSSGLMKEAILDAVSQFHGNSACHFAVSSVAADLSEIGRIKGEAEAAMRFGKVFDPDLQIYFYDNYMIYHLFSRSIDNPVMIKLYEDVIKRVTIYDAEHKTSLIETLRELVLSDFNMQVTAKRLFIHRNTLYRRIEKLEELLGLDFQSSRNDLILQIAVRLQQLFN